MYSISSDEEDQMTPVTVRRSVQTQLSRNHLVYSFEMLVKDEPRKDGLILEKIPIKIFPTFGLAEPKYSTTQIQPTGKSAHST
jgi:hypothetical protein